MLILPGNFSWCMSNWFYSVPANRITNLSIFAVEAKKPSVNMSSSLFKYVIIWWNDLSNLNFMVENSLTFLTHFGNLFDAKLIDQHPLNRALWSVTKTKLDS